MIGIFNNKTTKTDLTLYNGEYILDNICTSYEITEELNGEYSFDGTFIINNNVNKSAYDLLVNDSLLKVDDEYGIEYFRIAKITKDKRKYEIFARHITISETLKMFCEDVRPTNLNGSGALNWIFNNARGNKWLEVSSDIDNTNTAYYQRKTVYEALFDSDNSFINRWGGEVYRRGFRLSINAKVGADRGVSIRSGKNLKGIEERSNINTLITSIYPIGFDGITIPEKFINSDLINYYSDIYPAEVKFSDVKVKSENSEEGFDTLEEAQEELRRRAKSMFIQDKVDILTSSYTVTFTELQKAEGYKDYSILEKTFLGDIVSVYEEKLGINIKVRVTKRVYDGIKKRRKTTTLSNKDLSYKAPSINQVIEKLKNMDSTEEVLNLAKEQATALIKSGLKNSHVIVRPNEIIIGDTKDINTMTKVWRFNNNGLGYSSTGYFGEYGLAMTQDGTIVADFIKAGMLSSFNNESWIDMVSGLFSFGKGALKLDKTGLTMETTDGTYGTKMSNGTLEFKVTNEIVGGIVGTSYTSNKLINGICIANTSNGDYLDLGTTDSIDFRGGSNFTPTIRLTNVVNELLGNFKGIQLLKDIKVRKTSTLYFGSNDDTSPHEIYNTVESNLALFGDNGVMIGYRSGDTRNKAIEIVETPNNAGTQIFFHRQLSMADKNITSVGEIYKYASTGRYFHEGWCGSIDAVAKRISNLNASHNTGLYAFGQGTNGAPCTYGTVIHIRWSNDELAVCSQIVMDVTNNGQWYIRSTTGDGATWGAWQTK